MRIRSVVLSPLPRLVRLVGVDLVVVDVAVLVARRRAGPQGSDGGVPGLVVAPVDVVQTRGRLDAVAEGPDHGTVARPRLAAHLEPDLPARVGRRIRVVLRWRRRCLDPAREGQVAVGTLGAGLAVDAVGLVGVEVLDVVVQSRLGGLVGGLVVQIARGLGQLVDGGGGQSERDRGQERHGDQHEQQRLAALVLTTGDDTAHPAHEGGQHEPAAPTALSALWHAYSPLLTTTLGSDNVVL
jgi:hypothetical protein